jgi:hypothetical protein
MPLRAAGEFPTPAFRLVSALVLVAAAVTADVIAAVVLWGENGWIYPVVVGAVGLAVVPLVIRAQRPHALIGRLILLVLALVAAHVLAFWIWAFTFAWE